MRKKALRKKIGASQMGEFGPALGVLLIGIFFPLIDMLSVCLSYGLCVVLNNNQVHEASLIPADAAADANGSVKKGIPDAWLNGMGHFVKTPGPPDTTISYRNGQASQDSGDSGVVDKVVRVTTTVVCAPFLPIPLPIGNIPGLNGPMTFTISSERTMENPDFASASAS